MTRAVRVGAVAAIFVMLYLLAFFQFFSIPFIGETAQEILPIVPWWLLVSFGSYSLWSLGMGLFTFSDCPEAYTELLQEVSQAKDELRSKGITVD